MNQKSTLQFFLNLAKFQTRLSRRLDSRLGGLGFNEFIILYRLNEAGEEKMRRIDLAESVGFTASGITRLLLPMEKVGLIKKESNAQDARSSFVVLAPGGKRKLSEALERLEIFSEDTIPSSRAKQIAELSQLLVELEKNI
ncbi:MAG TPA: MarR family transcriptional regulator [Candidatus Nanoarchaeia archaeon]|nr:MarR family transcriptional regulator [Candidatus Nanoarchaeia archaeon]